MTMPKFEPVAFLFQHEDTGLTSAVDVQQVEWGFEKNNPRHINCGQLYTADQLAESYEAGKREASEDLEQAAFEKWLYDKCPSGDVESVQRQWLKSYEYAEFAGKRDATPEWQPIETAPRGVLEILLRSPNGKIANGYWGQECNRGKGAWVWPYVKSEPSHWTPLPATPKGEA